MFRLDSNWRWSPSILPSLQMHTMDYLFNCQELQFWNCKYKCKIQFLHERTAVKVLKEIWRVQSIESTKLCLLLPRAWDQREMCRIVQDPVEDPVGDLHTHILCGNFAASCTFDWASVNLWSTFIEFLWNLWCMLFLFNLTTFGLKEIYFATDGDHYGKSQSIKMQSCEVQS